MSVASRLPSSSAAPASRHAGQSLFGSASQPGFGRLPAMVVSNICVRRGVTLPRQAGFQP